MAGTATAPGLVPALTRTRAAADTLVVDRLRV